MQAELWTEFVGVIFIPVGKDPVMPGEDQAEAKPDKKEASPEELAPWCGCGCGSRGRGTRGLDGIGHGRNCAGREAGWLVGIPPVASHPFAAAVAHEIDDLIADGKELLEELRVVGLTKDLGTP